MIDTSNPSENPEGTSFVVTEEMVGLYYDNPDLLPANKQKPIYNACRDFLHKNVDKEKFIKLTMKRLQHRKDKPW